MEKNKQWNNFIQLVKKEVVPALGCTEPISLALAAARAASLLDGPVEVETRGGSLRIDWAGGADDSVFMTGPATTVFDGQIQLPDAA